MFFSSGKFINTHISLPKMHKQRNLQTLMLALMTLGSSMYGMFLPIFFLNNGVSFTRIIYYFIALCLGGAFSSIVSNFFTHKYGIKFFIVLRGIVEPVLVLIARFYPILKYPVELYGFVFGFVAFAYWISMDAITVKFTDNKARGSQQSFIYGAMWLSVIIAPFIGGLIIKNFSYPVLFFSSLVLILSGGIISLFMDMDMKINKKFDFFPKLNSKLSKHMVLVFIRGFGFPYIGWLFTLIVYEFVKDEFIVGTFGLILGILSLIATFVSGKLVDKVNRKWLMSIMFFGMSLSFVILGLGFNSSILYVLMCLAHFFHQFISVPLNTIFFNEIEKLDIVTLVSERMMAFSLGGAISLFFMLILDYKTIFLILGPLTLTALFYTKEL